MKLTRPPVVYFHGGKPYHDHCLLAVLTSERLPKGMQAKTAIARLRDHGAVFFTAHASATTPPCTKCHHPLAHLDPDPDSPNFTVDASGSYYCGVCSQPGVVDPWQHGRWHAGAQNYVPVQLRELLTD